MVGAELGIKKDLVSGKIAEDRLVETLTGLGWQTERNDHKDTRSYWDILARNPFSSVVPNCECTFEVKNDVYALKSGNIAVEYFNPKSNKASGLTVSKADFWVYMVGDELWVVPTAKLRSFVEKEKPHRLVSAAGDKNADIILYKKDHLFTIFTRIDNNNDALLTQIMEFLETRCNDKENVE